MMRAIGHLIRRHFPPSIRAQMTIFYTITFAVLLGVILLVSIAFLRASAPLTAARQLNDLAKGTAAHISLQGNKICVHPPLDALPGRSDATLPLCAASDANQSPPFTLPDNVMMRLLTLGGQVIYVSPSFTDLDIPTKTTQVTLSDLKSGNLIPLKDHPNQSALFLSTILYEPAQQNQVFAILQIAVPSPPIGGSNDRWLLIAYPVLVILGGFGAYGIATRALRPVRRVTQAAQGMAQGDLGQRVPVPVSRDDIHTLALTFNEMAAKLDAAFAQQRRFVADASHELRTPVAVIRSMTDVALAHAATPEDYQATLREVGAEAERLGRLINTLLGLARADDGRQPQERDPVRLDHLVTDVAESLAPLAQEHGLSLTVVRNDPAEVVGDTAQIIQILMSLTENAINYTPSGGLINLSVATEGALAHVRVSDTGIGIAPDHLTHIFERFFRTDEARTRVADGNGLGLALAREFARAHGGDISVLSHVGQGSTFTLTLPRRSTTA